ncbi:MAG: hypothetical protein JWO68_2829 [Actinomycetia bacterium]|nr:hypothetical protein [Actinomycetes bacterium]
MIWELRGDDVWLALAPNEEVTLVDLVTETTAVGYEEVDHNALEEALVERQSRRVAVIGVARRPGFVAITVDEDGMRASARIYPPGPLAPALTAQDVLAALTAADVTHGIDEAAIGAIPLDHTGVHVVAHGSEPVDGEHGEVQFMVEATHEIKPTPREDGGVDLYASATIPKVLAGELLATIIPETPGESGWTVRGEELLARKGRPAKVPKAKNVELTEDGLQLVATIDGLLELSHTHIAVRPDLTIAGDVDFETGSVDFHGDVLVNGSVRPGFHVKAGGRVIIAGDVEQAEVEGESLVWVRGAIVGDRCVVRSNGDVKVRTVHEARIEARGSVFVEKEANEATILASQDLVFESPRNRLVGGTVWVGHEVIAAEIGAVGEIVTRVTVGIDPFTAEEIQTLHAERTTQLATLDRVKASVGQFLDRPEAVEALDAERRPAVARLLTAHDSLIERLAQIESRLEELQRRSEDESQPRVVARLAIRPGVMLTVRRARRTVDVPRFRVMATEVAGAVELLPLERDAARIPRSHAMK